jgi:hypothetical protein
VLREIKNLVTWTLIRKKSAFPVFVKPSNELARTLFEKVDRSPI